MHPLRRKARHVLSTLVILALVALPGCSDEEPLAPTDADRGIVCMWMDGVLVCEEDD